MLLPLTLVVAMSVPTAPLPRAPEAPTGAPPRIVELKPDADGKIRLQVVRTQNRVINAVAGNGRNVQQIQRKIPYRSVQRVELSEVKDLTAYTVDGKSLDTKDLQEKLAQGGIVIISSDGQKVSPAFLKLFRDDVIILTSPELTEMKTGIAVDPEVRPFPGIGGIQVRPLPAPAPGNLVPLPAPIPADIQIQVAPNAGGIGALPAIVPAAPPVAAPRKRQPVEQEPAPVSKPVETK